MKRLFKVFVFLYLFNLFIGLAFFTLCFSNVILPSMKGTKVTFIDVIKNDFTGDKFNDFRNNLEINSKLEGKRLADKFVNSISFLLPEQKYQNTNVHYDPEFNAAINEMLDYQYNQCKDAAIKAFNDLEY